MVSNDKLRREKLKEPFYSIVESMRIFFHADTAILYLISAEMDIEERREYFHNRFGEILSINDKSFTKEDNDSYSILRFIGVTDGTREEEKSKYWDSVSYNNLPDKYVIIHLPEQEVIPKEGLTGRAARRNEYYIEHIETHLETHDSRNTGFDDTSRKIHPPCKKTIIIPLRFKHNQLQVANGVLRLDIYNDKTFFNNDSIYKLEHNSAQYIEMLSDIIELISTKSPIGAKSYKELYKGEKLLNSIKELESHFQCIDSDNTDAEAINRDIFDLLKHLFFVFQRNTYTGHEEIMQRVLNFVDDLCTKARLPKLPFRAQLSLFKKQEDLLLYDIAQYRDHFMHQFHVFVIGYIIINNLGLDNIASVLNSRLKHIPGYNNQIFDKLNVLRIWILTAFYHDISYIFEKYDKGVEKFINDLLNMGKSYDKIYPINKFAVEFDWEQIISSNFAFSDHLKALSTFFHSPNNATNSHELLKRYFQVIIETQDHGTFSAMMLIDQLISFGEGQRNKAQYEAEIYFAALAISLHNACISKTLREGKQIRLSYESFPIEFILVYADTVQEWGRRRKQEDIYVDGPEFDSLLFHKRKNGHYMIRCNLSYEENHPSPEKIENWSSTIRNHFASQNIFEILYKFVNADETIVSFPLLDIDE